MSMGGYQGYQLPMAEQRGVGVVVGNHGYQG
jgi:hypothetical protein